MPTTYVWGLNERYYIDSDGVIEENDGESPPQSGQVPKFIAAEILRLAAIERKLDGERDLSDIDQDLTSSGDYDIEDDEPL